MSTDKNAKMSGKNFKQRYLNYVNWKKMLKNNQFLLCNLKKYKKNPTNASIMRWDTLLNMNTRYMVCNYKHGLEDMQLHDYLVSRRVNIYMAE